MILSSTTATMRSKISCANAARPTKSSIAVKNILRKVSITTSYLVYEMRHHLFVTGDAGTGTPLLFHFQTTNFKT